MAALLLSNLALLAEASSSPRAHHIPERPLAKAARNYDAPPALTRSRRDHTPVNFVFAAALHGAEGSADAARARGARHVAGASGGSSSGEENSDADVEGEDEMDWEGELRQRLKDMEEMKELERRAEELQSQAADDLDGEETEEQKRERVRRELEKVAKEQAERRRTAQLMFEVGQKAYGKGMYSRSIEFLEAALTIVPRLTLMGGEIQIWLAMAYEANNRHKDCIELYKLLEMKHPIPSIRRQAAELRYILDAPKLKISREEMVTIPLIGSSYDWYAGTWSDKYKNMEKRRKTAGKETDPSKDFWGDFITWRPPSGWHKSPNFWAIVTIWLCLVGTALYLQQ